MSYTVKSIFIEVSDVVNIKYARHEAIRASLRNEADVSFEDDDRQRHKVNYIDLLECVKEVPY